MNSQKYDTSGLIVLWALAESGIGGILHALHLPFTGIFVGGFAILSISLIAWYNDDPKAILKALSIVLAVKLMASPHSPWQAYVAVAFQGGLGYWIYHSKNHFRFKTMVFATLCMMESALQKILIATLIFGSQFWEAIDKSAINIAQSINLNLNASIVTTVFTLYTFIHVAVGIGLGVLIPALPRDIEELSTMDYKAQPLAESQPTSKAGKWIMGLMMITVTSLALNYFLPANQQINLLLLLLRVVLITLLLTFVLGPIVKYLIHRYLVSGNRHQSSINRVIEQLPAYKDMMVRSFHHSKTHYSGWKALKMFLLGVLVFSLKNDDKKPA